MHPDQYCSDLSTTYDGDFRYSLLGLSRPQRHALSALHAFYLEATRIPQQCQELAVAQAKLDWWRSEVQRLCAGCPQHPVTSALLPHVATYHLAEEYFHELLDGVAMDLEYDLYPNFAALTLYLHRLGSVPALWAAEVCGYQEARSVTRFAHEAGILLQLCRQLCQVRAHAQQGYCYIPEDELQRFGVDMGDLLAARGNERVRQLFAFQAQRIHEHYQRAQSVLPDSERLGQSYLLIRMELAMALLEEIATDDYRLLEQHTQLTPLRKLWLAWRWRWQQQRRARQLRQA